MKKGFMYRISGGVSVRIKGAAGTAALLFLVPALLILLSCKQNEGANGQTGADSRKQEQAVGGNTQDNKSETKGGNPVVIMSTSKGDIKIELYRDKAPITVENFLGYVNDGFYDDTIFHRVINNFMIQGGGISSDMKQKPTKAPIKNEADNGLKNERGTIAMARTGVVDSATSQFFINHVDNSFLDHGARDYGYAVFGKVIDGMDVVDEIAAVKTGPGDVPEEVVLIKSVKVVEE